MSEQASIIKIFVSSHKPADYVKSDIFVPIQTGAALTDTRFPGFACDNVGENISEKNPFYCELTTQYYAWKNVEADYYGFFHYRRYLAFNEDIKLKDNSWGVIEDAALNAEAIQRYGLDDRSIINAIDGYDIILPKIKNVTTMPTKAKSTHQQYLTSGYLHDEDLRIMLDVIGEKYPDFLPVAKRYLSGKMSWFCNMFIMRKEIFQEYSRWLFDILEECNKRIDYTDYSVEARRTPGHLAERLLNIYIMYLKAHKKYKIKELHTVIFRNTNPMPELKPAFSENNIAIVLAADDNYVPYLATTITSIIENATAIHNYDILVMNKDISQHNQQRLQRVIGERKNFALRFIDMAKFEEKFSELFLRGHFAVETWFRLMLPEILSNYDKVLYLDSDLVANYDVAELYKTDVTGYLLAACHDADTAGLYLSKPKKRAYMDNVLKISKPYNYFQAGVVLFNLADFREKYTTTEMLTFARKYKWELLDQDVLNYLAQDKVKFVDMSWNVMFDLDFDRISSIISYAPKYLYDAYLEARKQPKIVHYAGDSKPWEKPSSDFAYFFWKYARKNECYEQLVQNMCVNLPKQPSKIKKTIKQTAKLVLPENTKRREVVSNLYHKVRP